MPRARQLPGDPATYPSRADDPDPHPTPPFRIVTRLAPQPRLTKAPTGVDLAPFYYACVRERGGVGLALRRLAGAEAQLAVMPSGRVNRLGADEDVHRRRDTELHLAPRSRAALGLVTIQTVTDCESIWSTVMHFEHSSEIWRDFPELVPGLLAAEGITPDVFVDHPVARYEAVAAARLESVSEGEFPEVQAWRRAFSRMGLKPTQYRCASEALLRRYRKEGSLPRSILWSTSVMPSRSRSRRQSLCSTCPRS